MVQSQSLKGLEDLIESLNVFLKTERIWKDLLLESTCLLHGGKASGRGS